ncbi:hypothetical protein DC094_11825 [Pelagibaculum spongiae]|uniref:Large ribosomal RNA subunit accumulation protein YceD n=2 Tax=Pelagibaculum spongiae TaxID=2080658 RepID=A0A2V1GZV1_9GAMM|nr:hypothetical protein DC094_11825 [Pelagibaculum spongiae]
MIAIALARPSRYHSAPMKSEILLDQLDPVRFALKERDTAGGIELSSLKRLSELLHSTDGLVEARFSFSREGKKIAIRGDMKAQLKLVCHRCGGPVDFSVEGQVAVSPVTTEADEPELPEGLEPVLMVDREISLWQVVEDEILLALPPIHRHEQGECGDLISFTCDANKTPVKNERESTSDNPFAILKSLRSED